MEGVVQENFPKSNIQRCMDHIQRNLAAKCRVKSRTEISVDFKTAYKADSKEDDKTKFNEF